MKLYHITKNDNIKSIMQNGLIPQINEKSKSVNETNKLVYLCPYDDIPVWKIILGYNTVLCIDLPDDTPVSPYCYSVYMEYTYDKIISPTHITIINNTAELTDCKYKDLLFAFVDAISYLSTSFARQINYPTQKWDISVPKTAENLLNILRRLDYSKLSDDELRAHLIENGDEGEYTLCDRYVRPECICSGKRLWQLFGLHPAATAETKAIYDWLKMTFKDCLFVNTGGWCG